MKPKKIEVLALTILLCFSVSFARAQKYKSTSSYIHFFSDAPMEDIEAENSEAQSAFDLETGQIVFSVPIEGFIFDKSLMQEHFNENYLESHKFPKATFSGTITDYDANKSNWQDAKANGAMTIHGVENAISSEGKIRIVGNQVEIEARFPIKVADYKIKIPKVVFYNIAETVDVTIKMSYEKID